jgi:aminoglycoside 6-adenylyltransferase
MRTEPEIMKLILDFATADERIRAVLIEGSRADPSAPKDKYQDYDISFAVTETESFQADKNWLNAFGDIAIINEGERNGLLFFGRDMSVLSRRCVINLMLRDFTCFDFIVEIKEEAAKDFADLKPNIILIDKDNFLSEIDISAVEDYSSRKPNEDVYRACCGSFWRFIDYPAKGIARGQIPFAMVSFNSFTRTTLNKMIEWYIDIQTDFSVSIKRERFYEKYLPEDIYDLYARTYTDNDYWDVIFVTCELFNKLALAVGAYYGFAYNRQEENIMIEYLQKIKNGLRRNL